MKLFLAAALTTLSLQSMAQIQPVRQRPEIVSNLSSFDTTRDEKNGQLVFRGSFTSSDLRHEPTFSWFQQGLDEYRPKPEVITALQTRLPLYELRIFMGTWCEDSQYMIPRLYKVLLDLHQTIVTKRIIGMDRAKTTTDAYMDQVRDFKITLVPTIVVMKDGQEVGRITETVNKSVEEDLLAIMK